MPASKLPYEAPEMKTLGTVHEMTLYKNKVGPDSDMFTGLTGISGSIVSHP